MEGEYFVFEYYTSQDMSSSCLVPLRVVDGCLKEIPEFGNPDPQEINWGESQGQLMKFLEKEKVTEIWSCGGHCMYDEVLEFNTHYSGGEGKYAFHYDSVVVEGLEGIAVKEFINTGELSEEEREGRRQELLRLFGD